MTDNINPTHYKDHRPAGLTEEAIEYFRDFDMDLGNAGKYVYRAGIKNKETRGEDLEKAMWYIEDRYAKIMEGSTDARPYPTVQGVQHVGSLAAAYVVLAQIAKELLEPESSDFGGYQLVGAQNSMAAHLLLVMHYMIEQEAEKGAAPWSE